MKFYQEFNLPAIPESVLTLTVEHANVVEDIGYGYEHRKLDKVLKSCTYTYGKISHQPLIDWLVTNIKGIGLHQIMFQTQGNGTHIVHSDIQRFAALNYIIDEGGDNVITSWYQENDKPLKRNKLRGGQQSDSGFVDYANLTVLESARFEKGKWYLLDVQALHDVDNIETLRKSITINIRNQEQLDLIKETNNILL